MVALTNKLIIGISSRALFNLDDSHQIFESDGIQAYADHQIANENEILQPGTAFNMVRKLLAIKDPETQEPCVEVILLSRNSADTGLRIFNSIKAHDLTITRAAFTNGESPYEYVSAFKSHLFLSAHAEDVRHALQAGCAAAQIFTGEIKTSHPDQVRIAFDGDSVLFSDEAEQIFQRHGLQAFAASEQAAKDKPLSAGPLKGFLQALHDLQARFTITDAPIRTALVTARSAPTHERVINTFRDWDIRIDEAMFLGGLDKGDFLKAFQADFFFDDQIGHCQSASQHVATGHVLHGISNELDD